MIFISTRTLGSVSLNAAMKTSTPLNTPGSRAASSATAVASAGIRCSDVTSPFGASSRRAAPTTSLMISLVSITFSFEQS